MRVLRLIEGIVRDRDLISLGFLGLLLAIISWLVLHLTTTAVPSCTLNRFHLQTNSFLGWSLQQIVPSMYSFENSYEFRADQEVPAVVTAFAKTRQLNHFPLRVVTFFDGRYALFHSGNGGDLVVTSRYRNLEISSQWNVVAHDNKLILRSTDVDRKWK